MKQIKVILPLLIFALFLLFLIFSQQVQETTYEALLFCGKILIPSLFPGFVLSDMLIHLSAGRQLKKVGWFSRLFHLPSACFRCWVLGLLAGFPTAADGISKMVISGEISKTEGERCLAFTNNPGIVFVVCAVGSGLFGSLSLGFYLWVIQTAAAFLIGLFFAEPGEKIRTSASCPTPVALNRLFPKAVVSSVSSVLNICGFVVFFRVVIGLLTAGSFSSTKILLAGLLEMTCGISVLSDASLFSVVLASFLLGWSGLSVHFQIIHVVSSAELSVSRYFPGKVWQALLSALFTGATYPLILGETPRYTFVFAAIIAFFFIVIVRLRKEYLYGKRNFSRRKSTP